jgi:signal peptidase I
MRRERSTSNRLGLIVSAVLCGTVATLYLSLFVYVRVQVPTGSMYPTISLNDKLLVSKNPDVVRGDIVVFYNEELNLLLVKRLVGSPGDRIELISGELFVNGELTEEPYVMNNSYEDFLFEVPEGKYLFLGDNRSASFDARFWVNTYIDKSRIVGRVVFRYYPITRIGFLDENV